MSLVVEQALSKSAWSSSKPPTSWSRQTSLSREKWRVKFASISLPTSSSGSPQLAGHLGEGGPMLRSLAPYRLISWIPKQNKWASQKAMRTSRLQSRENRSPSLERGDGAHEGHRLSTKKEAQLSPNRALEAEKSLRRHRYVSRRPRAHAFEMATKALQRAANQDLPLQDWQDIERADKIARRAVGLENDASPKVSVSLNLVPCNSWF